MILILGPPGAGKSAQAKLLEAEGLAQWLSIGQILREKLTGSDRRDMESGKMVNDDVVDAIMEDAIEKTAPQPIIVMDGYPRRDSQVRWLKDYLVRSGRKLTKIVHIQLTEEVSVTRLKQRGRMDDDEETVEKRFQQYLKQVVPLIEMFKNEGVPVHEINGDDSISNIHKQIIQDL